MAAGEVEVLLLLGPAVGEALPWWGRAVEEVLCWLEALEEEVPPWRERGEEEGRRKEDLAMENFAEFS